MFNFFKLHYELYLIRKEKKQIKKILRDYAMYKNMKDKIKIDS